MMWIKCLRLTLAKPRVIFWLACSALLMPAGSRGLTRDDLLPVSLIQLIATPEQYDGHVVRVIGFVHIEFEGNAIYLHREDYQHNIIANALWLDHPECMTGVKGKPLVSGYALVEGTFNAKNRGHMSLFSGAIEKIDRCHSWGP
jgi:hypothetical protein